MLYLLIYYVVGLGVDERGSDERGWACDKVDRDEVGCTMYRNVEARVSRAVCLFVDLFYLFCIFSNLASQRTFGILYPSKSFLLQIRTLSPSTSSSLLKNEVFRISSLQQKESSCSALCLHGCMLACPVGNAIYERNESSTLCA